MNIHELNTKAITSPAWVALDDGEDTYKVDLNATLSTLQTAVAGAETDATDALSRATTLQSQMATAQGNIAHNQDDIADLQSDLASLETSTTAAIGNLQTAQMATEADVTDLQGDMSAVSGIAYSFINIPIDSAPTGFRLNESDGLCTANVAYKLIKYKVSPGQMIRVKSDDRFQFQSIASVPSYGASNRIGITYGTGVFVLEAPVGATYLIVSTPNTDSTASVELVINKAGRENSIVLDSAWNNIIVDFENVSGCIKYDGTSVTYSNILAGEITVTSDDIFILNAKNYYEMAIAAFKDSNNNVISTVYFGNNTLVTENNKIFVPYGATKMVLQTHANSLQEFKLIKVTKGAFITPNAIVYDGFSLNNVIANSVKKTYAEQTLSFESKTGYYNRNTLEFTTYSGINGYEINVTPGEKYLLSGYAYYDMAMWVLLNDNTAVSAGGYGDVALHKNIEITIPTGVNKLLIERKGDTATNLFKLDGYSLNPSSILDGAKVTVIGDSITEYNFRAKTNWVMWMEKWTNCSIQNLGISGTGFVKQNPYIDRINQIQSNPDIIGVAISWNDMSAGLPVGTISDTGTASIAGYANDFFDALIAAFPTVPIICYCQSVWASYRPGVSTSDTWFALIKEICALKGIPFYGDMYNGSVLRPWNDSNKAVYYTSDNDDLGNTGVVDSTHPNSEGHKVIARFLYPKFAENLVSEGLNYN